MNESVKLLYQLVADSLEPNASRRGNNDNGLARKLCRLICRRLGGNDVYFPVATANSAACQILLEIYEEVLPNTGYECFERFCERGGGVSLYVPRELRAFRRDIAFEILRAREAGVSMLELTQHYHLSSRTLQGLRNLALYWRTEQRQQKLF